MCSFKIALVRNSVSFSPKNWCRATHKSYPAFMLLWHDGFSHTEAQLLKRTESTKIFCCLVSTGVQSETDEKTELTMSSQDLQ